MTNEFIVGLLQPRPPDKIFYKFNEKNCKCLQYIFQQIILVIKLFITKTTDFWSFWIIFLENHC